ncbi:AAA family ATPase [Nocardia sp. NPDC059177]|uniref:AAA family ATPase n=1 Tax=Nocardia sp. NPDC059177 TaxID=3346759 RepID=UPI0036B7FDB0
MCSDRIAEVVARELAADPAVEDRVGECVLAALTEVDGDQGAAQAGDTGVFLRAITVHGFRGIGPTATLRLNPGPGLTLVVGRNGSGKSSFAEAAEFALTGGNRRWDGRSTAWREGWRNLHEPDLARIEVDLLTAGEEPDRTIATYWAPGADLSAARWTERRGTGAPAPIDPRTRRQRLDLYRPFLSYSELGALVDGKPSDLFDALHRLLGLDELAAAAERIRLRKLELERAVKDSRQSRTDLLAELADVDDDRARRVAALLDTPEPDLDAIAAAVAGSVLGVDGPDGLRAILRLTLPDPSEVAVAADRLAEAATDLTRRATTDAEADLRVLELLTRARDHVTASGTCPCPVCGSGTLDPDWLTAADTEITHRSTQLAAFRAARTEFDAAQVAARALFTPIPAELAEPNPVATQLVAAAEASPHDAAVAIGEAAGSDAAAVVPGGAVAVVRGGAAVVPPGDTAAVPPGDTAAVVPGDAAAVVRGGAAVVVPGDAAVMERGDAAAAAAGDVAVVMAGEAHGATGLPKNVDTIPGAGPVGRAEIGGGAVGLVAEGGGAYCAASVPADRGTASSGPAVPDSVRDVIRGDHEMPGRGEGNVGLRTRLATVRRCWAVWAELGGVDGPAVREGDLGPGARPASGDVVAVQIRETYARLSTELAALQRDTRIELDRLDTVWSPLVPRILAWLDPARAVSADAEELRVVKRAADWLKSATATIRGERMRPLESTARWVWSTLRQQSNVELGAIRLQGSAGTARRVLLDVTVDEVDGAALGVMSQGELHALGLSLFLPRATVAHSPFRFVMIDDPVQAMDPAKVDGLARVLAEVAATRQVVVFTHDERLAEAVRRMQLDATVLEVQRRERSLVEVRVTGDPVRRYLDDARSLVRTPQLPPAIADELVATCCRSAIEAAGLAKARYELLARGLDHAEVERRVRNAHTTRAMLTLAIMGPRARVDDLNKHLTTVGGRWLVGVLRDATAGAHVPIDRPMRELISDTERFITWLREHEPATVRT